MTAINEDRNLLGLFLRELVKAEPPTDPRKLSVLEQQYPGEEEPSEEEELERLGIPDGWIFDIEGGWCVFIEVKVIAKLNAAQITSHRRTAARRGFERITAVAIAPVIPASLPAGTVLLEWRKVFAWLRQRSSQSIWAARAADYVEIAEAKLIATEQFVEGTLTTFSGFPFGPNRPFNYLEGKRVLVLALRELRTRRELVDGLGMNPTVPGRPAITGRQDEAIWDYLSLSTEYFTSNPHLTLNVGSQSVEAMVTVPHAVNAVMRRNLIALHETGFRQLVEEIVNNLEPLLRDHKGATPWFRGVQRRYPSQRATPFLDARIEFDLRTAIPAGRLVKSQSRWLTAGYGSLISKEGSNYQIQIGVVFRYERCQELREVNAIDLIASAWLACKPLVDLRGTKGDQHLVAALPEDGSPAVA